MAQEKTKARQAVRAAQKQFERESDAAQRARRKAFAQAQKEGLSLREIGEEVGFTARASRKSSKANDGAV
jgi:DNA-directed RNA polymerase specialized sigma24 family protein